MEESEAAVNLTLSYEDKQKDCLRNIRISALVIISMNIN